jgi:hypothetical protein
MTFAFRSNGVISFWEVSFATLLRLQPPIVFEQALVLCGKFAGSRHSISFLNQTLNETRAFSEPNMNSLYYVNQVFSHIK